MNVHGFSEENITVLMDDGEHPMPTRANILAAYEQIVSESEDGDVIFLHYSGQYR
jgi:metacaspase-1